MLSILFFYFIYLFSFMTHDLPPGLKYVQLFLMSETKNYKDFKSLSRKDLK